MRERTGAVLSLGSSSSAFGEHSIFPRSGVAVLPSVDASLKWSFSCFWLQHVVRGLPPRVRVRVISCKCWENGVVSAVKLLPGATGSSSKTRSEWLYHIHIRQQPLLVKAWGDRYASRRYNATSTPTMSSYPVSSNFGPPSHVSRQTRSDAGCFNRCSAIHDAGALSQLPVRAPHGEEQNANTAKHKSRCSAPFFVQNANWNFCGCRHFLHTYANKRCCVYTTKPHSKVLGCIGKTFLRN